MNQKVNIVQLIAALASAAVSSGAIASQIKTEVDQLARRNAEQDRLIDELAREVANLRASTELIIPDDQIEQIKALASAAGLNLLPQGGPVEAGFDPIPEVQK